MVLYGVAALPRVWDLFENGGFTHWRLFAALAVMDLPDSVDLPPLEFLFTVVRLCNSLLYISFLFPFLQQTIENVRNMQLEAKNCLTLEKQSKYPSMNFRSLNSHTCHESTPTSHLPLLSFLEPQGCAFGRHRCLYRIQHSNPSTSWPQRRVC